MTKMKCSVFKQAGVGSHNYDGITNPASRPFGPAFQSEPADELEFAYRGQVRECIRARSQRSIPVRSLDYRPVRRQ